MQMKPTRRRFLESTVSTPLAASLGGLFHLKMSAAPLAVQDSSQEVFPQPQFVRYDADCFVLNDRDTFIYSTAFHYPRCPRALWHDRLFKLKRAGFNTIETYVFWNYHEPEEGKGNLAEFEDFVKLVHEMGFWMIARPGPYICAEWERGGFPEWVVAKRFPLRSNNHESIQTSQHWYNLVLPVIARHQITASGPIIMMQVENEYDYWRLADADKREYVGALARMAWDGGISVPLITCWTKQVRERQYPDMARIMDTCNFYPRWDIVKEVVPQLQKLRKEEPASPVGVTELQGGWFSEFGGKLSVDQEGVNGAQLNMVTKTAIEQGATYFSYYMGFGGTNFDWAAKKLTTTYDYAAPLREPGGLWEKYYAARGICVALGLFGSVLTRAKPAESATQSTNKDVSVTERINGKSGVVFVRENANAEQNYKMTFRDPNSPTGRPINVPREGELVLGAREMKMLPVQINGPGGKLRYTTAEVLAYGVNYDRPYVVLYDEPGRLVEFALSTENEPHIEGETVYQYWDSDYESAVIGVRVEKTQRMLMFGTSFMVVVLPRELALRSWIAKFPAKFIPGADEKSTLSVPFIADTALMGEVGYHKERIFADLDFAPGEHEVTALLPPKPAKCFVDGVATDFQHDHHWWTTRLHVTTPNCPYQPVEIREVGTWVSRSGQSGGTLRTTPALPLDQLGSLPYGYVKYFAKFSANGAPRMYISTFADDFKKVFCNARLVPEASNNKKQTEFSLSGYANSGTSTNDLEIFYELFGSPNFGENLGEMQGIESARVGADPKTATPIESWQIQLYPPGMTGRNVEPGFSIGGWQRAALGGAAPGDELAPAFTWCQAEFSVDPPAQGWFAPWKVTFEAGRDALLYLNGKFVGRYVTKGPQKDFYLPEPYLVFEGKRKNILTIVLAYAEQAGQIRTLRVSPYGEFVTRRTRVEFEW
jgi:Glycosyl hydrolases family 35/Beta-galactosidase, domain 2/Beta-galactosidase jelly roll domain